jgi:hypothetical protein
MRKGIQHLHEIFSSTKHAPFSSFQDLPGTVGVLARGKTIKKKKERLAERKYWWGLR